MSDPDLSGMHPQARRFLAMVSVGAAEAGRVSAAERRRSFASLMRWSRPPDMQIETIDRTIVACGRTIPVRCYATPDAPSRCAGLIYFHGGGLVAGSIDTHDALCRSLASGAKCRIVSVDYRLAPEHPFPAAIVDTLLATRAILRNAAAFGLDRDRIGIGGDSGGATLATIAARIFRAGLKAQVLLCPVLDFAGAYPSRRAFASGFLLDAATMQNDLAFYAPRRPLLDPHVSPLRARDLSGVPHAIIHTAGFDPLRDEGEAYVTRLREAGVRVEYRCHSSLIHHFYGLDGVVPAARDALSKIAADIEAILA